MQSCALARFGAVVPAVAVLSLGCGGRPGGGSSTITGIVVQGAVAGATVTAYGLDASLTRKEALATTTTSNGNSAGTFSIQIHNYSGLFELVASGGTYTDEASGIATEMAGFDLSAIVDYEPGKQGSSVTISPISNLASAFARYNCKTHGTSAADAITDAYTHLNAHFGGVDWRTIVPADPAGITNLDGPGTAGLILAALSQEASDISTRGGGKPGVLVTAALLANALASDAGDGALDGVGLTGAVTAGPAYHLDDRTARFYLATSLVAFVASRANLAGITTATDALAAAISEDSDPYLFKTAGPKFGVQPPPVSLISPGTGAGPYYVNTATTTLSVTATPVGNGVAGVFAAVSSSASPIKGTYNSTANPASWQLQIPLAAGSNTIQVYATDNSGQGAATNCVPAGGSPSNCITLTVVQDTGTLTVSVQAPLTPPSYYDENAMTVGTTVPPVYDANGNKNTTIDNLGTIHKAATRVAPANTHRAADLEEGNPDNLPWLQFSVALTGAPLKSATYSIAATTGAGGSSGTGPTNTYTGDLLPWVSPKSSVTATTGAVVLDLPLDSTRIPSLATTTGSTSLSITVSVADAAGNTASTTQNPMVLTYYVIGAPLNIALDSAYPTQKDANSTYAYTIAAKNYGAMFNGADVTTFGNTQQVRILRYVVTNPASQPVAFAVPSVSGPSWAIAESWPGISAPLDTPIIFNNTCPPANTCAALHQSMYTPPGGTTGCNNDPGAISFSWSGNAVSSNALATLAFVGASGSDSGPAQQVGGNYIVPAATGTTPGVLSLYVTRPLVVQRSISLGAPPYQIDHGRLYAFYSEGNNSVDCCAKGYVAINYTLCPPVLGVASLSTCIVTGSGSCTGNGAPSGSGTYCQTAPALCTNWANSNNGACTNCTGTCFCSAWTQAQMYATFWYLQQLEAASESLAGSWIPTTYGSDNAGKTYGSPSTGAAKVTMSASVNH